MIEDDDQLSLEDLVHCVSHGTSEDLIKAVAETVGVSITPVEMLILVHTVLQLETDCSRFNRWIRFLEQMLQSSLSTDIFLYPTYAAPHLPFHSNQ